ncbi:MAG TPA: MbcA/ParS/Xre antitoxin family protein [Longimicrobium sp.]|nr:MbcA/ParS/Xre antitoxin family protein [Longimicrobium sp.]
MGDYRVPEDAPDLATLLSASRPQSGDAGPLAAKGDIPSTTSNTPIARVLEMAESVFGDRESARTWLNRPIPELEDQSPLGVILAGEAGAVETLLENARGGIPG